MPPDPPSYLKSTIMIRSDFSLDPPLHMANSFNDFFANVANNLVSNLPPSSYSPLSFMPNCRQFHSFYLSPTSVDEILYEISNLNLSKSCGPFSIPITILKLLKHQISLSLVDIFNCSFSTSTVPDKFKIVL